MKFEKIVKIIDIICLSLLVVATGFVVAFKFLAESSLLKASIWLYIFSFIALMIFNILCLIQNLKDENDSKKGNVWPIIKSIFCAVIAGFAIFILISLK